MMAQDNLQGSSIVYTVRTQNKDYPHKEINASLIRDIIQDFLTDDDGDFLVLEPDQPIEGSIYMQAIGDPEGSGGILSEVRIVQDDESFRHYSYLSADPAEAVGIFLAYWEAQQLPDLSGWTDITAEFE